MNPTTKLTAFGHVSISAHTAVGEIQSPYTLAYRAGQIQFQIC